MFLLSNCSGGLYDGIIHVSWAHLHLGFMLYVLHLDKIILPWMDVMGHKGIT